MKCGVLEFCRKTLVPFGSTAGVGRPPAMLVLSRKPGEKILIGDKISITVVRIAPGIVRIGVDAPDDLPILREELATGELPVAPMDSKPAPSSTGQTG